MDKPFHPTTQDATSRLAEVTACIQSKGYVPVRLYPYYEGTYATSKGVPVEITFKATTPLHYAATMEDEAMAADIIDQTMNGRSDVERATMLNKKGYKLFKTPLIVAICYHRCQTVKLFLRYHVSLDTKAMNSCIGHLLREGGVSRTADDLARAHVILQSILSSGASQECRVPLYSAISIDPSNELLRLLLEHVKCSGDELGNLMMLIIFDGKASTVEILLQHGASSNYFCRSMDKTPLMAAVQYCRDGETFNEMFRVLQAHGVDLNQSESGCTALNWAFEMEAFPAALKLIRHGADVNRLYAQDGSGNTKNFSLWINPYERHRNHPNEVEDYTVWLERYYNLRGLNKMLVYYGLDVARLCTVDENNVGATISVGECHLPNVASDGGKTDGGRELRAWMLQAKQHIQIHGPLEPPIRPHSVPSLVAICRDRLFDGNCDIEERLLELPKCLQDYVGILNVNAYDPHEKEDLRKDFWRVYRDTCFDCPDPDSDS